jgi:hypothetical protein
VSGFVGDEQSYRQLDEVLVERLVQGSQLRLRIHSMQLQRLAAREQRCPTQELSQACLSHRQGYVSQASEKQFQAQGKEKIVKTCIHHKRYLSTNVFRNLVT